MFVDKKMYKPFDQRVIVRITKKYHIDKGKPVLDEQGDPVYTDEQEAKVIASGVEGIKKGDTVIPILRGGIPIFSEENKKYRVVIIDREDIYGVKV